MKNTLTEIKNSLEGIDSRLEEAENWINDLEDKVAENAQLEQWKKEKKNQKYKDSLRSL